MSNTPEIPVDFNNCDADGAVRLVTRGTVDYLRSNSIALWEGLPIRMTDGELTAEGVCTERNGMWVAVVRRWIT